jgi:hypothetical protein
VLIGRLPNILIQLFAGWRKGTRNAASRLSAQGSKGNFQPREGKPLRLRYEALAMARLLNFSIKDTGELV